MITRLPPPLDGLLDAGAYPHDTRAVEVIQTHISYVLLAGEYAYKIKKPVDFGFVDYGSLARRRAMCEAEVRLNRRLCEHVYLGVEPITRDPQGRLRVGGQGEPIEYAVRMRRVPGDRMLPALLEASAFPDEGLRALATRIARFHDDAPTSDQISVFGTPAAVRGNWEENFAQTDGYFGRTLSRSLFYRLRTDVDSYLRRYERFFLARADDGRIRDTHGDLRADSVVVWPDGGICIMDCIEFNDRLRYGDVASDLAFLAMDLEFRGYRRLADALISAYMDSRADETLTLVLNFYRSYRAFVRGKVDSLIQDEPEVPEEQRNQAMSRAQRYFEFAANFLRARQQALIIICGLSGTGKSWVGSALAGRAGAALVRSDVVRQEVRARPAQPQGFGEGAYSPDARTRIYETMFERAAAYLDGGASVVLDATFFSRALREQARALARARKVRFLAVEVTAPPGLVREWLSRREGGASISDARWDTYLAQRDTFEPPDELSEGERLTVDSSRPLDENVSEAVSHLRPLA